MAFNTTLAVCLIGYIAAFFGAFGVSIAVAAWTLAGVLMFAGFTNLLVSQSARLLNRASRSCRQTIYDSETQSPVLADDKLESLKSVVESTRQKEKFLADCYASRRCAIEDWLMAQADRVSAELKLVRYQKTPRSWEESCFPKRR